MESRTKTPHEMLLIKGLAKVALAPVDVEGAAANGPIALRDAGGRGILIGDGEDRRPVDRNDFKARNGLCRRDTE